MLLNGSLGFAMLLALLFSMPSDIKSVLNSETYYPFMSIYTYAVGSTSGATALVSPSDDFFTFLHYQKATPNFRLSRRPDVIGSSTIFLGILKLVICD